MKGGVAAMIYALEAPDRAGNGTRRPVVQHRHRGGVRRLGRDARKRPRGRRRDAVVIPEPTGFDSWIANDGVSYFRVTVEGKSAHAAETDAGVNAISKLLPIITRLRTSTTSADDSARRVIRGGHEHTVR